MHGLGHEFHTAAIGTAEGHQAEAESAYFTQPAARPACSILSAMMPTAPAGIEFPLPVRCGNLLRAVDGRAREAAKGWHRRRLGFSRCPGAGQPRKINAMQLAQGTASRCERFTPGGRESGRRAPPPCRCCRRWSRCADAEQQVRAPPSGVADQVARAVVEVRIALAAVEQGKAAGRGHR